MDSGTAAATVDPVADQHHGPSATSVAVALAGLATLGAALVLTRHGAGPSPPSPTPTPGASCAAGQVGIVLSAEGPGSASGCGVSARDQALACPWVGETCVYTAWPDGGGVFDHWEGPDGITATQNPITLSAFTPGFVRARFNAKPGIVAIGPGGQLQLNPPSMPAGLHPHFYWDHLNIAGHWISLPDFTF